MYILKDILTWIFDKGQIIGVIIGFGLAFFTLFQIIKPKLKKIEKACEGIDYLNEQTKGRLSFVNTVAAHELRLGLIEKDISWIIKICDRRKEDIPVKVDRRVNQCDITPVNI